MKIPYDPDFDSPIKKIFQFDDVFTALGSVRAFVAGLLLSFLLTGTVGFIIMLVMKLYE